MMKNAKEIGFKQKVTKGNATFELRESGHVIGGSTVLVESEKKRLFYTGDIKTNGSRMLREMDLDIGEIDLLITESTYAKTEQKPRKESEKELIEFANEVMDRKGILFIPSFSVERSQEIACILKSVNFKHKIIMDGMALKVNEIMFRHPDYLRDPKVFSEAINSSTENDGINNIPFLSITSFANSINSFSDSFLGFCSVLAYVLSVISKSVSPMSKSISRSILEPFVLISPV